MQFYLDIPVLFPGKIQKTYDLIVPEGTPSEIPLLVWIHGGGWCGGEKRVYNDFERFSNRGFAVLSIDYRFSQEAPFPAQLIDCKRAIRWARANAAQYGYCADKIVVGGSSAGGHLAALLGVTNENPAFDQGEDLQYSSTVQAVVDEFGPADLDEKKMPGLTHELRALLQDDPQRIAAASPLRQITGNEPPFFVTHGTADPLVPVEQSRLFAKKLLQAGVNVTYLEVAGGEHGFDTTEFYHALTDFICGQFL